MTFATAFHTALLAAALVGSTARVGHSAQSAPSPAGPRAHVNSRTLNTHATGTFDVKLTPQPVGDEAGGPAVGRMAIEKRFRGDLDASSRGQMLAAGTEVPGSAGYVAMERVTGTLHGRAGTFVLQHSGTMDRGVPHLAITVVPDSGTSALAGLTGAMTIEIRDGQHFYAFDYALPEAAR